MFNMILEKLFHNVIDLRANSIVEETQKNRFWKTFYFQFKERHTELTRKVYYFNKTTGLKQEKLFLKCNVRQKHFCPTDNNDSYNNDDDDDDDNVHCA